MELPVKPFLAKLGEAGKWHRVLWYSEQPSMYRTACQLSLEPFSSSVRAVKVETTHGAPTCKNCIRVERRKS